MIIETALSPEVLEAVRGRAPEAWLVTVVRACRVMLEECCVTVALVQPGHVSGSGRGQGRQSPARSTPVACTRAPRASGALARP